VQGKDLKNPKKKRNPGGGLPILGIWDKPIPMRGRRGFHRQDIGFKKRRNGRGA